MGLLDVADGALAFPYKELEGYNDDDAEADAEELLVVWLKNKQKIIISFQFVIIYQILRLINIDELKFQF